MLVGPKRVISHGDFVRNLRRRERRGAPSFEVRSEVPLSEEPPRIEYLLLRKLTPEGELVDHRAQTLRHLWPRLPRVSMVEYKSPGRPYRPGELDRLWGCMHTYFASQCALLQHRADGSSLTPAEAGPEVRERQDLRAVLVVAARSPSLDTDVEEMGLTWEDLGSGYLRVHGGAFTLYVVEIDVAGPAEGDDLLYSFGHGTGRSPKARWFWMELVGSKDAEINMQDMEGYQELMERMLDTLPAEQVLSHYAPEQRLAGLPPEQRLAGLPPEQRLAGLPPEQRLAGLPPEQRLAGLDRDHQALALPVEVLQLLPDAYLRSLAPDVEAEIRRRLRQNGR